MRKCCWKVFGIEILVVIWIAGRQDCCLAWVNFGVRSPPPFYPFLFWILVQLAQFVSLSFCEILNCCLDWATT